MCEGVAPRVRPRHGAPDEVSPPPRRKAPLMEADAAAAESAEGPAEVRSGGWGGLGLGGGLWDFSVSRVACLRVGRVCVEMHDV